MNFIGKNLNRIGILLLATLVGAAASLYFDMPARTNARSNRPTDPIYTCPMHPDVMGARPGACPKCGMALVTAGPTGTGHSKCGEDEASHPGCCSKMNAAVAPTGLKLPPGHPPIHCGSPNAVAPANATR